MKVTVVCALFSAITLLGSADGGTALLAWDGTRLEGAQKHARTVPVEPGKVLRLRGSFRIHRAEPGFRFDPRVLLTDEAERPVATLTFDELLPRPQDAGTVDCERYVTVPEKAKNAVWRFDFYGNAGAIEPLDLAVTAVAAKPRSQPMRYRRWNNPGKLDDRALDARLAQRPPARAAIRRKGEYNTLEINGAEVAPTIYHSTGYNHIPDMRYNMASWYHRIGINLISVPFNLGVGRPSKGPSDIWRGPGRYCLEPLRAELRKLLKEAPDTYILLAFNVTPYRGYGAAHPQELFRTADGRFGGFFHGYMRRTSPDILELAPGRDGMFSPPSYYSQNFNDAAAEAIREVCRRIAAMPEGKAVAAVYLNGGVDGQWFDQFNSAIPLTADYSPAALKAFRSYLKQKYENDVGKLRTAWREPAAEFDAVQVPSHAELWRTDRNFHTLFQTASRISDYCEFLGYGRAQRQIQWCRAVKQGSGGRWLAGSYYSNSGLRGYPQLGLQSVRHLLDAPEAELFTVIPNYLRNCREPVHQGGFAGSLTRHGKLLVTELDLRNGELPYWGRWGTDFWRSHTPAERFIIDAQRFAASAAVKGRAFHIYDMEGGCFNSEKSLEAWKKASALLAARTMRPITREHIGVIASECFWNYQSFGAGRLTVYDARETPLYALYRAGVKNSIYLLEDALRDDFDAPRVVIFLEAGTLTPRQAAAIRKRFANSNRVLVWVWCPGMFTDGGEQNLSGTTGFKLERAPGADQRPLFADGSSRDPLMEKVRGFLFPHTPPSRHGWGMAYRVADSGATVLAHYSGTRIPGMAVRRYPRHTEVYLGAPGSLTPQLCRNFARAAGVEPFLETDDFCGTGAGLLYVSALTSGNKTIRLPDGATGTAALTGQSLAQNGKNVSVALKAGELLILKLSYERK